MAEPCWNLTNSVGGEAKIGSGYLTEVDLGFLWLSALIITMGRLDPVVKRQISTAASWLFPR